MCIVLYLQGDTTKNDAAYWKQMLMKYLKKCCIWGSHSSDYEEFYLLGFVIM
jgi:hypothetical protein